MKINLRKKNLAPFFPKLMGLNFFLHFQQILFEPEKISFAATKIESCGSAGRAIDSGGKDPQFIPHHRF